MNSWLVAFLLIDAFAAGIIAALVWRHGHAHYQAKTQPKKATPKVGLSPEMRKALIEQAAKRFEQVLDHSADHLGQELQKTGDKIDNTIQAISDRILEKEMSGLENLFAQYEQAAATEMAAVKAETDSKKAALKEHLEAEASAEKERLTKIIDERLADVLLSFLSDSLGHEIDLGAQSDYLLKQLADHKQELIEAVKA